MAKMEIQKRRWMKLLLLSKDTLQVLGGGPALCDRAGDDVGPLPPDRPRPARLREGRRQHMPSAGTAILDRVPRDRLRVL